MQTYKFTAYDENGKKFTSTVQGMNQQAAVANVKKLGYTAVNIQAVGEGSGLFSSIRGRVSSRDKIIFSRQLSTLINAGLPLVQSIRTVMEQTKNKNFQKIIGQILSDVEAGSTFSAALSHYPNVFNQIFINLVAAGETSGNLDGALERLSNQQEKDAEVLSKVRGALIYPAIVILVMVGVVGFMIVGVLPQVKELYTDLDGASLPFMTTMLLALSDAIIKYWFLVIVGLVIFSAAIRAWSKTSSGKSVLDQLKFSAPLFGQLFRKLYMARFSRTGTTLVASGVPILQMLEVTSRSIDNVHVENSINKAAEKVKGGKSLSSSLEGDKYFLSLVPQMLKVGEESGNLEAMLAKTADYYEKEVDNQIRTISTIIEPALMVVLGIVALIIVSAVLLPIYNIAGSNLAG